MLPESSLAELNCKFSQKKLAKNHFFCYSSVCMSLRANAEIDCLLLHFCRQLCKEVQSWQDVTFVTRVLILETR